jgi:hypothetical protein
MRGMKTNERHLALPGRLLFLCFNSAGELISFDAVQALRAVVL